MLIPVLGEARVVARPVPTAPRSCGKDLEPSGQFRRLEGQAVLRANSLVATAVFHVFSIAGRCEVTGTIVPAT